MTDSQAQPLLSPTLSCCKRFSVSVGFSANLVGGLFSYSPRGWVEAAFFLPVPELGLPDGGWWIVEDLLWFSSQGLR